MTAVTFVKSIYVGTILLISLTLASPVAKSVDQYASYSKLPKSEYEYMLQRDTIIQAEKEFEKRNFTLSKDETIVDQFLAFLKWKEAKKTKTSGFPPSRPIETILKKVQKTKLYSYLKDLPKGGNLHSHEDHQLSKRILFDIVWNSVDFDNLYIVTNTRSPNVWMMDFFVNPPKNEVWVKVKDSKLKIGDILKKNTLLELLTVEASNNPTDATKRWQLINPLWGRASVQLISNINIKKKYLWAMYNHSMSEGVSYLETRRSLGWEMPLYSLDRSGKHNATNGKQYLDPTYEMEVTLAKELIQNFSAMYPRFIGHKRISYAVRFMDFQTFDTIKNTTLRLFKKYPEHVIGFDAVGEEDAGYASLHYLDNYLSLQKDGISAMPLYLHSVETSWPDDLLTGEFEGDLVPTLNNGYESVILLAKRVGHGKGFIKKPFLKEILKVRQTAVEICVVSNQILGMDADIRNHYGNALYKEGIPIVLAPDDPGTFGYDNVTIDWYLVYLGWGLNLGDLKKIALNSLIYNGMSDAERQDAIDNRWQPSWNEYITKMKDIACKENFGKEASVENRTVAYHRILPAQGPAGTKVHIFGRNFEIAICKVPMCKFGNNSKVEAVYESNQHLTCIVPANSKHDANAIILVQVALSSRKFLNTDLYFQYTISNYKKPSSSSRIELPYCLLFTLILGFVYAI